MHLVLLIGNPIKRLKSRTQKHTQRWPLAFLPLSLSSSFAHNSIYWSIALPLIFSHPPSVFFFVLTQSQSQSSSTLPRSHSLSEVFCMSVYHHVYAFINYLPIHFCITYSLLLRCITLYSHLVNKTNRRTEFQFYWYYYSTCFGQPFCPSSGVPLKMKETGCLSKAILFHRTVRHWGFSWHIAVYSVIALILSNIKENQK